MAKYDVIIEVWITTHGESKEDAVFRAREAIVEGLPHALVRTTRTMSVEESDEPDPAPPARPDQERACPCGVPGCDCDGDECR